MEKLKYNIDDFPFREMVRDWFKVDLDRLHEEKNYKHFTRKTDQQTHWHKLFYEKVRESNEWDWHYKWFIKSNDNVYNKYIEIHRQKTYSVNTINKWLNNNNFKIVDIIDADTGSKFKDKTNRLIYKCIKKI